MLQQITISAHFDLDLDVATITNPINLTTVPLVRLPT